LFRNINNSSALAENLCYQNRAGHSYTWLDFAIRKEGAGAGAALLLVASTLKMIAKKNQSMKIDWFLVSQVHLFSFVV